METSNHPARKIKQLLKSYTMTVQELSERLGITLESLREILDERAVPTPNLLRKVASLFGADPKIFGASAALPAHGSGRDDFDFSGDEETARPAAGSFKGKASGGAGRSSGVARASRLRSKKKLDLTEMYVRYQVLFELLLDKKVFTREEYQMRMEIIRAKLLERRAATRSR